MNDYQMMEKYIYEVTRKLPTSKREDIKRELMILIEEELQSNENATIESVLKKLGNPRDLAFEYMDKGKWVIGPQYYDEYIRTLSVVLPITLIVTAVGMLVGYVFAQDENVLPFLLRVILSLWQVSLTAFALVTVGFAITERFTTEKEEKTIEWDPQSLKKVVVTYRIKKSEPIATMVFLGLMMVVFNFFPHLIAIYYVGESMGMIPVLNLDVFRSYLLWINFSLILSFVGEMVKLLAGKWTLKTTIFTSACAFVGTIVMAAVLLNPGLLNPALEAELIAMELDMALEWINRLLMMVVIITIAVFVASTASAFYKALGLKKIDSGNKND